MQIVRGDAAAPYCPPKHTDVRAYRLQGGAATDAQFCWVGLSFYAPGGRADMDAGPQEKIYVVLAGELTVELGSGEQFVLGLHDSCLIAAHESRAVRNESAAEATLLVITPPPS
jgi:quercetin dioxygenase-like cupin family protein